MKFNRTTETDVNLPEDYRLLFSHLPNVQRIFLQNCSTRVHHSYHIALNASLFTRVAEISVQGLHWSLSEAEAYINCALMFKDKLTHMKLTHMKLTSLGAIVLGSNGVRSLEFDFAFTYVYYSDKSPH